MHICILPTPDLRLPTGSTLHAVALAEGLAHKGHVVDVICKTVPHSRPRNVRIRSIDLPLSHPVVTDPPPTSDMLRKAFVDVFNELVHAHKELAFDVVHAHYATFTGLAAAAFLCTFEVPFVVSSFGRDVSNGFAVPSFRNMMEVTFRASHSIVVPNRRIGDLVMGRFHVPEDKIACIPMGVNVNPFKSTGLLREKLPCPASSYIILNVQSNIAPDKGGAILLHAFARLQRDDSFLVIIGGDDTPDRRHLSYLQRLAGDLDIYSRVMFTGHLPHRRVLSYMADANIYADCRTTTNESTSLYEAAVAGLPLIYPAYLEDKVLPRLSTHRTLFDGDLGSLVWALTRVLQGTPHVQKDKVPASILNSIGVGAVADMTIALYRRAIH